MSIDKNEPLLNFDLTSKYCTADKQIKPEILQALNEASASKDKKTNFSNYLKQIANIFELSSLDPDILKISTEKKIFLGGFIEGEGSINVSAKKGTNSKFGLVIDPEFNITQHASGVSNLYTALAVFRAGTIKHKHGSDATLVLTIGDRETLVKKLIPFWEKYIKPYGSVAKNNRMQLFIRLLELFQERAHLELKSFSEQVLPLWDAMRLQKSQSNQSFKSLEDAQEYIRSYKK